MLARAERRTGTPSPRGICKKTEPISESGLWKCVVKYAHICGLAHVKVHDFRRYVGTQLTAKGDIRMAQKALGHKDISVTARQYALDQLPVGVTDNLY